MKISRVSTSRWYSVIESTSPESTGVLLGGAETEDLPPPDHVPSARLAPWGSLGGSQFETFFPNDFSIAFGPTERLPK